MGNGTSIGRVRGLGSARAGAHTWLMERLSGLAVLATAIWLVVSLLLLPNLQYAAVREWAAEPVSAIALGLLIVALFWHTKLGLQVLIEDYVHEAANKLAALIALSLFTYAGAAFGLYCVVRLALGGA